MDVSLQGYNIDDCFAPYEMLEIYFSDKAAKISVRGGEWCQVLGGVLGALGVVEEKNPCGSRGLA